MRRLWYYLSDRSVLAAIGLALAAAVILLSAQTLQLAMTWAVALAIAVRGGRRRVADPPPPRRSASEAMETMLQQDSERAVAKAAPSKKVEIDALRKRLHEAIGTIKPSKLGQTSGGAALYELPWYVVIGNPAAGKSTAVVNSGLHFPFSDKAAMQSSRASAARAIATGSSPPRASCSTRRGATRCTRRTASEWLGFLRLLKKNRPKAPINGVIIVASVPELTQQPARVRDQAGQAAARARAGD